MKKILKAAGFTIALFGLMGVAALFISPQARSASVNGTYYMITPPGGSDPCQNPSVLKLSAPIAITSATTTNLLSAVSGDYITVCKFQIYASGTAPSVEFEYGTTVSTACDTGATALTGTIPIPTGTVFNSIGAENDTIRTPVSQQLCLVTAGTSTPTWEGYFTYTQQPY
jgi:hypothetical protein